MQLGNALISGLTFGALYALTAMSFNVVYRPTNIFNFAQGGFVTIAALLFASMAANDVTWWAACVLGVLSAGVLSLLSWRTAVAPVLRRSQRATAWIITTLAFSLILTNAIGHFWDADPHIVAAPSPLSATRQDWRGLQISSYQVAVVFVVLLVLVVVQAAYRTRLGRVIRAVSEDREAAQMRGIRPDRIDALSMFAGGAIAGLVGVLATPMVFASIDMGLPFLIKGFAAAALGGLGHNSGALVGGLLIGVTEAVAGTYMPPSSDQALLFGVVLAVLLLRPHGLQGREFRRVV